MNDNLFSLNQRLLCFLLMSSTGAADKELILVLAGLGRAEVLRLVLGRDARRQERRELQAGGTGSQAQPRSRARSAI